MEKIIDRILKQVGDEQLLVKLLSLSKSDLNSLLLELFKNQTMEKAPMDILKSYQNNRFSVPSKADPAEFHGLEAELLTLAKSMGMKTLLLSPSAPLGRCSVFSCVNQNNVISSLRGTETLSDPTNMLAIIIADKLIRREEDNQTPVHYGTTARVVRAQNISAKGYYAHFGMYCMVSSGKDRGSYICEKEILIKHLEYYKDLFLKKYKASLSIVLRKRSGYADNDGFFNIMSDLMKNELPDVPISYDLVHEDNQYYKGINFKLYLMRNGETVEVGDGGFVDWISKITGNKKERTLISAIGLDRLLLL